MKLIICTDVALVYAHVGACIRMHIRANTAHRSQYICIFSSLSAPVCPRVMCPLCCFPRFGFVKSFSDFEINKLFNLYKTDF